MKKRPASYFLPEIGQPMLRALKLLAPHFKEIREMWNKSMESLKLSLETGDLEQLAGITLEAHYKALQAGKLPAYSLALAKCGQVLEDRGVPPIYAMIALSLYLESCCTLLFTLNAGDTALTMALAHLNSASQSLVIDGYSREHSTNWVRLAEKERRRFTQDLHDEIGQNLIVLKLYLELMARDYKRGRKEDVIEKLEEAMTLVSQSIVSVRRLILDLGPAALDQVGLMPSFKAHAAQFSTRTGIEVEVRGKDISVMPRIYETALFRVFQGALSNVAKHSKAKTVRITVKAIKGSTIQMTIEDNGIGFVTPEGHTNPMFGLTSMRERVETLGGHFSLKSWRASSKTRGSGTRIDVTLAIKKEDYLHNRSRLGA